MELDKEAVEALQKAVDLYNRTKDMYGGVWLIATAEGFERWKIENEAEGTYEEFCEPFRRKKLPDAYRRIVYDAVVEILAVANKWRVVLDEKSKEMSEGGG